jgi:hypothetical protein
MHNYFAGHGSSDLHIYEKGKVQERLKPRNSITFQVHMKHINDLNNMHQKSAYFINALFDIGNLLPAHSRQRAVYTILKNMEQLSIDTMLMMLLSFNIDQSVPYYKISHDTTVHHLVCSACGTHRKPSGCIQPPCSHCDAMESFTILDIKFDRFDDELCCMKVKNVNNNQFDWLRVCRDSLHAGTSSDILCLPHSIKKQKYDMLKHKYNAYLALQHRLPDTVCVLVFEFIDYISVS